MLRKLLPLILLALMGCKKIDRAERPDRWAENGCEFILMIVIDLSEDFQELMAEDGKAYDLTMQAFNEYSRHRIGTTDQIIIAQISGERKSLLWQGTSKEFREDFSSPDNFRQMLLSKAAPETALVHEGLAHAMDYLRSQRSVASGEAETVTLVLSSLEDTGPNPEESEKKLIEQFVAYCKEGGNLGLYFISQDKFFSWRDNFREAGLEFCVLEGDVHGRPRLPSFEE